MSWEGHQLGQGCSSGNWTGSLLTKFCVSRLWGFFESRHLERRHVMMLASHSETVRQCGWDKATIAEWFLSGITSELVRNYVGKSQQLETMLELVRTGIPLQMVP